MAKHGKRSDTKQDEIIVDNDGKVTLNFDYYVPKGTKLNPIQEGLDWILAKGNGKSVYFPKSLLVTGKDLKEKPRSPYKDYYEEDDN